MGRRLALNLLLAAGCAPPSGSAGPGASIPSPLPRAVAVAMVVAGGQPLTAYFSVEPNPRGHIDVRVANNLQLPGSEGIFQLLPDGPDRSRWTLSEELGSARVPLKLSGSAPLRPVRFESNAAWLLPVEGEGYRCDLRTGACDPATEIPALELNHSGPGAGFRFTLTDRTLRFLQPHEAEGGAVEGDIVATRVLDLLSIRWLHDVPSAAVLEHLDRTFRGRGTLHVAPGPVTVDGEMEEWSVAEPEVVDAPWQAGIRDHWHGPTDASFSVAGRWQGAQVCFAGRFRDDLLGSGDTLTFAIGPTRTVLRLLDGIVTPAAEGGASEAAVAPEPFGWHYELCLDRPARTAEHREVAFAAWYTDADGSDPPDELGTAPLLGDTPTGTLEFSP